MRQNYLFVEIFMKYGTQKDKKGLFRTYEL